MRTVTTYIAFDDTEFENEEACIEYEDRAKGVLTFFTMAYKFYDKDKHIILIDFTDIDSILDDISVAYDTCGFIYYNPKYFTNDIKKFNRIHLGYNLPESDEEGMYKYNWNEDAWEKAD